MSGLGGAASGSEAPVRVAHIINSLDLGGAERFLVDLCLNLPPGRFVPEVVCLYRAGALAAALAAHGIRVHVLDVPPSGIRVGVYRRLSRFLRGRGFGIAHTHLQEACWYGLPAAAFAGIPVRVAHLQNVRPRLKTRIRLLDATAFRFGHAAIGVSQEVVDFYRHAVRYPAHKLHLVHNVVDPRRFRPPPDRGAARAELGVGPDEVVVTNVASLTPQKGHAHLLAAARTVSEQLPTVRFLLVGEGAERARLERLRDELGLGSRLRLLGSRTDVPRLLAASDVFVLPSLWEGLSLALLESGLAGLPAVVSDLRANREVVRPGDTGLLVPPGDGAALADALLLLARSADLRARLGRAAQRNVETRFLIESSVRKMTHIYGALLRARDVHAN